MKSILVTYYSVTGNTKLVAQAIHDALPEPKEIKPIDEVADLSPYSLLFVGFPVMSHSVPYKAEVFLRRIPVRSKVALFCTHGSLTGSSLAREALEYATVCCSQTEIIGTFTCRGKVSHSALEALKKSPEHEAWAEMAASATTHPDAADLEDARSFAKWILTLVRGSEF
jgi:flavodoxin